MVRSYLVLLSDFPELLGVIPTSGIKAMSGIHSNRHNISSGEDIHKGTSIVIEASHGATSSVTK